LVLPSTQKLTLPWTAILKFVVVGGRILGFAVGCFVEMLTGRIAAFAVRQLPKTLSEVHSLQLFLLCLVVSFD